MFNTWKEDLRAQHWWCQNKEKKILESRVNDVGKIEEKIFARSITDVSNLK